MTLEELNHKYYKALENAGRQPTLLRVLGALVDAQTYRGKADPYADDIAFADRKNIDQAAAVLSQILNLLGGEGVIQKAWAFDEICTHDISLTKLPSGQWMARMPLRDNPQGFFYVADNPEDAVNNMITEMRNNNERDD